MLVRCCKSGFPVCDLLTWIVGGGCVEFAVRDEEALVLVLALGLWKALSRCFFCCGSDDGAGVVRVVGCCCCCCC